MSERPILRIGGGEAVGASALSGVVGVVRLADGRVVVADAGSTELRFFAPTGESIGTAGGKGSGPGEMRGLDGLLYGVDTLFALDAFGGAHLFSVGGQYARTIRYRMGPLATFGGDPVGVTAGSALVGMRPGTEAKGAVNGTLYLELRRLSGDGNQVRSLARLPSGTQERGVSGKSAVRAFAPTIVMAAFAREICSANTATFLITCIDTTGAQTRTIRQSIGSRAVTDSMKRAWRFAEAGRIAGGGSRFAGSLRAHRERVARDAIIETSLPVIGRLLASRTGDLWVSEFQPSDGIRAGTGNAPGVPQGPTRWRIFSPSNVLKASIVTPARFRVFDAGADWVLGVTRDADDVERVEMWAIVHGGDAQK